MSAEPQKVCFVVMGFGKKTDYESGRTLDLDATYEAIIKPAVEATNMRCIRADEVIHSGLIDAPMYEMLLRADLVVADISTGNANAVYELGVRHALRPNSTIIMKESKGRLYFDLNHVSTFQYEHLGEDIGAREASRAKRDLELLIRQVIISSLPDSPVYSFLPNLRKPILSTEQYKDLLNETEEFQDHLSGLIQAGTGFVKNSSFDEAVKAFATANQMKPNDPYIIQQLTLATYKSKKPSEISALISALVIIDQLSPSDSNDPETLGITGAIYKRLWTTTNDPAQLNLAIQHYGRGFEIRRDYYNGENLALCHDYRSSLQEGSDDSIYDRISAKKVRESIIHILSDLVTSPSFEDRSDKRWIFASLANCCFGVMDRENGTKYEERFLSENPASWEIDTYQVSKTQMLELSGRTPDEVDASLVEHQRPRQ
jgi:tetratricopeptide (TPR) repeat protein